MVLPISYNLHALSMGRGVGGLGLTILVMCMVAAANMAVQVKEGEAIFITLQVMFIAMELIR